MDVTKIENPQFLKKLTVKQCEILAEDIRKFIIANLGKTGGHLSSNLGVVDLTIALHKVFNSPTDKIFFDVGHQCYTHKILTGRANQFGSLRQYNGLSGFQKFAESKHDVWEAGHSSTSLSAALGMAISRDLDQQNYNIVPIIGDGAMGGGMALEALNHIGEQQRRMVIIFNDNDMSISKNVGALTTSFSKLRTSKPYTSLKHELKDFLNKTSPRQNVLSSLTNLKNKFRDTIVDTSIFGEFDLQYLGPVDGHNIKELVHILEVAKHHDGPVVVHVITKKGKGYKYCEQDSLGKWHGVGPFNCKTGELIASTPANHASWSEVFSNHVLELAKKDTNICAITPAMINGSKLNKFFTALPKRSFDTGIAEEHATTLAAGLAASGKKPYLCIYSSFLQRAYDQINHDICRMDLPVVIGIDRAGLVGQDGPTHHGVFDISMLRSIPNIILAEPKDAQEAKLMLNTAFKQEHPMAIRYPRGSVLQANVNLDETLEIGSWTKLTPNQPIKAFILSYSKYVDDIYAKIIANDIPVAVVNCRFFKPLDTTMLKEIAKAKLPIIIYETDMLQGGLSSAILEWACDEQQPLNITRIGIKDHFVPQGSMNQLRINEGIDLNTLFEKLFDIIK